MRGKSLAALALLAAASGSCAPGELADKLRRLRALVGDRGAVPSPGPSASGAPRALGACRVEDDGSCPPERICAMTAPDRAECIPRYVGPTPLLRFPFDPRVQAACVRGPRSRPAHGDFNTLYAIDLVSSTGRDTGALVHSATEGVALVHTGCANGATGLDGKPAPDDCGGGFGNHVRVLDAQGYVVLYAHLSHAFVQNGQRVRVGEPIGREGRSGRAERRHLHFSIHYAPIDGSWLSRLARFRSQPGLLPPSIPFETQVCDPASEPGKCLRLRIRVEGLPCREGSSELLKADWRD
jgi:hypothetical protein